MSALKKLFILLIILSAGYVTFAPTEITQAFTMSNNFYIIILGNMNSIAGKALGTANTLTFTSGELGSGLYTGTNYTLCAGFYGGVSCAKPSVGIFTFTVTPTALDFGTIDPTSPVVRTNTLDVLSTSSGYSVTTIEDHSLQTASASAIPDTTCDSGTCNPSTASTWINILTYGFGYRCDSIAGTDCVSFPTDTYRPFANAALLENPQIVMLNTGSGAATDKQSQITYKVNISASQIPGVYTNTVTYVASPSF